MINKDSYVRCLLFSCCCPRYQRRGPLGRLIIRSQISFVSNTHKRGDDENRTDDVRAAAAHLLDLPGVGATCHMQLYRRIRYKDFGQVKPPRPNDAAGRQRTGSSVVQWRVTTDYQCLGHPAAGCTYYISFCQTGKRECRRECVGRLVVSFFPSSDVLQRAFRVPEFVRLGEYDHPRRAVTARLPRERFVLACARDPRTSVSI